MMRLLHPALLILLLAAPLSTAAAGDALPTRKAIERDLVLEATLTTPVTIQPGEPVRVKSRIVNRSKVATYKVVRPGDGSECGWREPHVMFHAETMTPRGRRIPVPERMIGRCGMFDANWQDDVVELKPGAALDLHDWMPAAHLSLDFQREGPTELRLHYRYGRGAAGKGRRELGGPAGRGAMGEIPAFELVSKPVRLAVVRLLNVRLEVLGALEVGRAARLSDVLRLRITNKGSDPRNVSAQEVVFTITPFPTNSELFAAAKPLPPTVERKTPALAGRATETWSGRKAWRELTDWQLTPKKPGKLKITAQWSQTGGGPRYVSQPVFVEIRRP